MSVQNNIAGGESVVLERPAAGGVYASLFEKINLNPVSELSALDIWQDAQAMSDATADERLTAGMQVFLECLTKAGSKVEKLDKSLIDHHIAELDYQISRQLDAVMHHEEFQAVESLWRGVKSLVDKTDFRQNVKIELLSMSKEDQRNSQMMTMSIIWELLCWELLSMKIRLFQHQTPVIQWLLMNTVMQVTVIKTLHVGCWVRIFL